MPPSPNHHVQHSVRNAACDMQGAEVSFRIQAGDGANVSPDAELQVYTTRPDTLFGVTYMVVAPEHPLLPQLTTAAQQEQVEAYVKAAGSKSELERTELQKSKTGIFTGQHYKHATACTQMHVTGSAAHRCACSARS